MNALFVLVLLPIFLVSGCSSKKSTGSKNVDEPSVESIPPAEEEYELPHILMFGDEEGATIVSSEFVAEQTYQIKDSLLSEYSQEEIDGIDVDSQIGGLIREKIYAAVNTELAAASQVEIAKVDNDDQQKTLNGLLTRKTSTDSSTVKDAVIRTTTTSLPVATPKTASAKNIKDLVKTAEVKFDDGDLKISGKTGIQYKLWRKIQDLQKVIQNFKKSDFSYFSRAIKKKKADPSYSKFDQMNGIKLPPVLKEKIGVGESSRIESTLSGKGEAMTLGMLPKKGLLEDVDRNNHARQNIKNSVDEIKAERLLTELDSMKASMLKLDADRIKNIRAGKDLDPALNVSYRKLKEDLGAETLEDALGSRKIEAEKRFEKAVDDENLAKGRTKGESIDYKHQTQEYVDNLRQSLLVLSPAQIRTLKAQGENLDISRLILTADQQMVINKNGGAQALNLTYQTFKSSFGGDVIDSIVIPRDIPDYVPNTKNMSVASIVEEFELETAVPSLRQSLDIATAVGLGEGRYRIPVKSKTLKDELGVDGVELTQFATRDRTMMTPVLLSRSIDYLKNAIKQDRMTFIHCKSGKGRSATVVVGTRADMVIEQVNTSNVTLTKAEIVSLVDHQIGQVQQSRPIVGVSAPQKAVLVDALFERQMARLSNVK